MFYALKILFPTPINRNKTYKFLNKYTQKQQDHRKGETAKKQKSTPNQNILALWRNTGITTTDPQPFTNFPWAI